MNKNNLTWLGFIATLTALSLPNKTLAYEQKSSVENQSVSIENRLNKIAENLEARVKELNQELPQITNYLEDNPEIIAGGWLKGRNTGFINNSHGGGFVNRRGWRDGGGFLNRRY